MLKKLIDKRFESMNIEIVSGMIKNNLYIAVSKHKHGPEEVHVFDLKNSKLKKILNKPVLNFTDKEYLLTKFNMYEFGSAGY